jgi:hypothetical protein
MAGNSSAINKLSVFTCKCTTCTCATVKRLVSAIACISSVPYGPVTDGGTGGKKNGPGSYFIVSSFPTRTRPRDIKIRDIKIGYLRLETFKASGVKSLLLLDNRPTAQNKHDSQHKLNLLRENSLIHLRCLQRPQGHRPRKNWTTGRRWQKS